LVTDIVEKMAMKGISRIKYKEIIFLHSISGYIAKELYIPIVRGSWR
jgi:hypothetical protein